MGVPTGSDEYERETMEKFGLNGSSIVDRRVQVVKTLFPKGDKFDFSQFLAQRAVLLVRNPLD